VEAEGRIGEAFKEIRFFHHYFFIHSKGIEEGNSRGYHNTSLLHHAVDPSAFFPISGVEKMYDCCFVGGWSKRRQEYIEHALGVTDNIAIYGKNWKRKNRFNKKILRAIKGTYIGGYELVKLYNASRIVLNITTWGREDNKNSGINMRVLEVPACRSFLLTDGSLDMESIIHPRKHVAVYEGIEDFKNKLNHYLRNEDERDAIAQEGYLHVTKHHTYDRAVNEICGIFEDGLSLNRFLDGQRPLSAQKRP
jgi:spore maturation protein CgeB